jgi:azurin
MKIALNDTDNGRSYAWAAVALADGSLDAVFAEAAKSPLHQAGLLAGVHMIPDAKLRATAYERVMPILAMPITEISGPDHIVAAIQRDAIRSAVRTGREPEKVFQALSAMIARNEQVPTAAQGIRALPRNTWPAAALADTARGLVAWAGKAHASERTNRDYVETIQIADELAGALPAEQANELRSTLAGLRVPVFVVRAVTEGMRFDTTRIVVQAGRPFEIIFDNPDVMPHNLVVVAPGARERIGTDAMKLPAEHVDRQGRAWVPESREILAATKLLENGQTETLRVRPIREEGVYEYVCTFPGHWTVMFGQLVVTKDVEAYIKANPAPASPMAPAAPATPHPGGHGSH